MKCYVDIHGQSNSYGITFLVLRELYLPQDVL